MLVVHVYMNDFWQLATISIQSIYGHRYQNQTFIRLFHITNAFNTFIKVFNKD